MIRGYVFLLVVFFSASPVFGLTGDPASATSEPQQMQDFSIAGYGARGEKTWEVQGASMDMMGDDVKINDITAYLYGSEKNTESMVLTADRGHFDRATGVVRLEDNVRAVTDSGAELTTSILDWSQKDQKITSGEQVNISKDNVEAVGTGIEAQPDMKLAKFEKDVTVTVAEETPQTSKTEAGQMTITCDGPMELDYEKQIGTFEKNVKVEGDADQGTMLSDKMTVYFSKETKQIDRLVAEGHVKIIRGENTSYSDSAIFTAAEKKVTLTGRPKLVLFTEEGWNVSP